MNDDRQIELWLRRLKWALTRVPSPEREDIVAEARAHFEDRLAGGRSVAEVLNAFGPPEAHARRFIDEMETVSALGAQRPSDLLGIIVSRVHRSLLASAAFLVILMLGGFLLAAIVIAGMKFVDPVHTGLWVGPTAHFVGVIDDPRTAKDELGGWIFPLAALTVLLAVLIGQRILIWTVRTLSSRADPS